MFNVILVMPIDFFFFSRLISIFVQKRLDGCDFGL